MDRVTLQGHQVVCSAFIEKDGKFLIVHCPRFNIWRVPGGRPNHGEKLEETLLREMKEELGVAFTNPQFIGWGQDQQFRVRSQQDTSRLIMFFKLTLQPEDILTIDPDEAEEIKWVTLEELKNISDKEGALTDLFNRNSGLKLD